MQKHFVTFLSPGTFVAEDTTKPIDEWDVDQAVEMAREVVERHGAIPYGFHFTTRARSDDELDSHEIARSATYYLGGEIETLAQVKARATEKDRILILNMETNNYDRIITNRNSYTWTQPFNDGDVLIDVDLRRPPAEEEPF